VVEVKGNKRSFDIRGCGEKRESDKLREKRKGKRNEGMESQQETNKASEEISSGKMRMKCW